MSWIFNPKLWLALASTAVVVYLLSFEMERTSPGRISEVHFQIEALRGGEECKACHGSFLSDMKDACLQCHEDIGQQLAQEIGLHGRMAATNPGNCAACHLEHLGGEKELVNSASFEAAGVKDWQNYDHRHCTYSLIESHLELACKDCHPSAESPLLREGEKRFLGLQQACRHCHEDPHQGELGENCESCHGQQAPFPQAPEFQHHPEFPLEGAHGNLACQECHPAESDYAVERVFGIDVSQRGRACQDCHPNPHASSFLQAVQVLLPGKDQACLSCHPFSDSSFPQAADHFEVELHRCSGFPLEPPHHRQNCSDCHPAELTSFQDRFPGRSLADCQVCHGDPHEEDFAGGTFSTMACTDCHAETHFSPHRFDVEMHQLCDFALRGSHTQLSCDDCHPPSASPRLPRQFSGLSQRCQDCHDDPHQGEFRWRSTAAPAFQGECSECHVETEFAWPQPATFKHGLWTGFLLDGKHGAVDCVDCHQATAERKTTGRRFQRIGDRVEENPQACASCHSDVHRDFFQKRLAAQGKPEAGCETCHHTFAFRGPSADGHEREFDHGRWTGFPLTGAHRQSECESCHGKSKDENRNLGWIRDRRFGSFERCGTCHPDPHGSGFRPAAGPPKEDCKLCHSTTSFRTVELKPSEHGRLTGFALQGFHRNAACGACHPPLTEADRFGRWSDRAKGRACEACHADPHAGQFRHMQKTDCSRCHAEDRPFTRPSFDHQKDSRFPLDATHRELDCSACHKPTSLRNGQRVVRYKPIGTRCQDCHGFGAGGGSGPRASDGEQ
ncbi:MAG: hypothetical protein DWQ01_03920 [Planctomycetota bacterium]|nr:MAG: hypothetical protein DWQ01_03920 [Planctomycetota bacterium]